MNENEIILGLDVSTSCIGYCLFLNDGSDFGKIIKMGHILPKISNKIKGIESLFLKKKIFNDEFLQQYQELGINKVIIEEPLLSSNNIETVSTLLRFNGMISDCVYNTLGIVPNYISSYEARQYAFPDLMSIRKYNKKGEQYPKTKILKSLSKSEMVLFGAYPFDCDKKTVMWNKVMENYQNIEWIYDKYGDLKKENYDANDALITCLGIKNKEKYGNITYTVSNIVNNDKKITYQLNYWDKEIQREIILD